MSAEKLDDNPAFNSLYERLRRATAAEMDERQYAAYYSQMADELAAAITGLVGRTEYYWRMKVVEEINRERGK